MTDRRTKSTSPAAGERRATIGYRAQYRVSAGLILRDLHRGRLEWVRVADPEAGRVDDLQIGTTSRLDAFQVKWSGNASSFTFRGLATPSRDRPSLIAQLANGWQTLRQARPGSRVVVHFVTNDIPSTADQLPGQSAGGHFAAFIAEVWQPIRADPASFAVPGEWLETWEALRRASGLEEDAFRRFSTDCELEFGFSPEPSPTHSQRDAAIYGQDLDGLRAELQDIVADPAYVVELNRHELLQRLGWENRVAFKNHHEFLVDEEQYQPIRESVVQLEQALATLPGGHIAVVGAPGTGKSTLLTQTLRVHQERVVRYYAYVPRSTQSLSSRGESANFLHDVVLALERQGFRIGQSLTSFDRDQLLERFHSQLQLLHEDWRDTRRKTIILVDGLDHIEREQHPERALFHDLPAPDQVPEGVYFVLGTQTDRFLPDRIQASVRHPGRCILMEPLDRPAVLRIVSKSQLRIELTLKQQDRVLELSAGHPLALQYLLGRIRDAGDAEAIDRILETTQRYEGDIEEQYHSYWRDADADDELVRVLGALARMRRPADRTWVRSWAGEDALRRLERTFGHYFRRLNDQHFEFFHNSFRLFLETKTAESPSGGFDAEIDRMRHRELAERCAAAPRASVWRWEELFHRFQAGEQESVLRLASQAYFREQQLAFRPAEEIQADVALARRSAALLRDFVGLARLSLVQKETGLRQYHLEDDRLTLLLLDLGHDTVPERIRGGMRLRVSVDTALKACLEVPEEREAQFLFELAEPVDLLTGARVVGEDVQREDRKLLEAWAATAVHFRSLDEVLEAVARVRCEGDSFRGSDEASATRSLQLRMLFVVGLELAESTRWDDFAVVLDSLTGSGNDRGELSWFWLQAHAWRMCLLSGDRERAERLLRNVLDHVNLDALGDEERVVLAEGVYRIQRDEVRTRELVSGIQQPFLQREIVSTDQGIDPFAQRLRLNRLLAALGEEPPLAELVADVPEPRDQGMVYFERAICTIAGIWGGAWAGRLLPWTEIERRIIPVLRLFNRSQREEREWTWWFSLRELRGAFYGWLVDAVAEHGTETRAQLAGAFEQQWENPETRVFWPTSLQRDVALHFYRRGAAQRWAIGHLRRVERAMLAGQDVAGRVEQYERQIRGWLTLDLKKDAERLLGDLARSSFGVGYRKDYQLDHWIRWLGRLNAVESAAAAERIAWFSRVVVSLDDTTEGRAVKYAAEELLRVTFRWSPRRSIVLFRWLAGHGAIDYEDAVDVLLHEAAQRDEDALPYVVESLCGPFFAIATEVHRRLVKELVERLHARAGSAEVAPVVRRVLSCADRYALPSTRGAWRREFAQALVPLDVDLREVGLSQQDLRPARADTTDHGRLRLRSGEELEAVNVRRRARSVWDLERLVSEESSPSWFDWIPLLPSILASATAEETRRIAELFSRKDKAAFVFSLASRCLTELGEQNAAWELAERALAASPTYGWSEWADGGSRLAAFRALLAADRDRTLPLLYDSLANEGGGGAENLEAVFDLVGEARQIPAIWAEIEEYTRELLADAVLPHDAPNLAQPPEHDSPARALAELLVDQTHHTTKMLAYPAVRACCRLLLEDAPDMRQALIASLGDSEEVQESALMVLDAAVRERPAAVSGFETEVRALAGSSNHQVRTVATDIAGRLGWDVSSAARGRTSLPRIYDFSFPPLSKATVPMNGSSAMALLDRKDPRSLVAPFGTELEWVAEAARVPLETVLYRTASFMRVLANERAWSSEAEDKLRRYLSRLGLRLPFIRPRAALARRAMLHVVCELVDAGRLGPEDMFLLRLLARPYDPAMVLLQPAKRPPWIPAMSSREVGQRPEAWVHSLRTAGEPPVPEIQDGRILLAEVTKLRRFGWGESTEVRRVGIIDGPDGEQLHQKDTTRSVEDYPTIEFPAEALPIAVHHEAPPYDSPGSEWLALHPAVGRACGWRRADEGLFRWVDEQGNVMVESLCWVDGPMHLPFVRDADSGQGWCVLAIATAFESIRSKYSSLRCAVRIERNVQLDESDTRTEVRTWDVPLPKTGPISEQG